MNIYLSYTFPKTEETHLRNEIPRAFRYFGLSATNNSSLKNYTSEIRKIRGGGYAKQSKLFVGIILQEGEYPEQIFYEWSIIQENHQLGILLVEEEIVIPPEVNYFQTPIHIFNRHSVMETQESILAKIEAAALQPVTNKKKMEQEIEFSTKYSYLMLGYAVIKALDCLQK